MNTAPALRLVRDPAGRPPANALDSEARVIGALLVDPEAIDRLTGMLTVECFYDPMGAMVFGAAMDLHVRGQMSGLHEILGYLRSQEKLTPDAERRLRELADEWDRISTASLEHHATRVADTHRIRRLAATVQRISAECYGPISDTQAFLDEAEASVYEIARHRSDDSGASFRDVLGTAFGAIQRAASRGASLVGVPTGFAELDELMGGLEAGEQTVLGARPGMGKTAAAMAIAVHAAGQTTQDGRPLGVYFASLEMSKEQLGMRTICSLAGVNSKRVRRGALSDSDWSALADAAGRFHDLPIWLDDKSGVTPLEIRSRARQLRTRWDREGGPELGLIIVDYLQLCRARALLPKGASREEEVSYVSQSLKDVSKDLRVPVLALAQLNRAVDRARDKRPELADLRESGAIEQNADNVIFLHREEYYQREHTPPDQRGVAELLLRKGRNCGTGTAYTRFYAECAAFRDDADATEAAHARARA